jgi:hypothetical protein
VQPGKLSSTATPGVASLLLAQHTLWCCAEALLVIMVCLLDSASPKTLKQC